MTAITRDRGDVSSADDQFGALADMGMAAPDYSRFQDEPRIYTIPETTLAELASRVRSGLHGNAFRVVGNPAAKVSRIALGVGSGMPRFSKDIDVVVGGGDNTGYSLDATSLGMVKGLLILGHVVSEESGMKYATQWLTTFLPDIPFIPTGEPFWNLD
jgi:putative NIF3 family GTP cyclohydrolase 1 type 2